MNIKTDQNFKNKDWSVWLVILAVSSKMSIKLKFKCRIHTLFAKHSLLVTKCTLNVKRNFRAKFNLSHFICIIWLVKLNMSGFIYPTVFVILHFSHDVCHISFVFFDIPFVTLNLTYCISHPGFVFSRLYMSHDIYHNIFFALHFSSYIFHKAFIMNNLSFCICHIEFNTWHLSHYISYIKFVTLHLITEFI